MSVPLTRPSAFKPYSSSSTTCLQTTSEAENPVSSSKRRKTDLNPKIPDLKTPKGIPDRVKAAFNEPFEKMFDSLEMLKSKRIRHKMTRDYAHFFALLESKFCLGGDGKFCLEEHIGSGDHGSVYKATDVDGKEYALKVTDHSRQAQFKDEVKHLQILNGASNLAHYVDSFSTTIRAFPSTEESTRFHVLALEYIPKPTLQDSVVNANKTLSLAQLGAIARQILECLKTFEEQGLVHCDLKPGNVLIDLDELIVTLIDLGGSWKKGEIVPESQPLCFKSAATTMGAPLTVNNDLFSLGCTLYTLLTKQLHFAYESLDIGPPLNLDQINYIILFEQLLYIGMPSSDFLDTCKSNKFFKKINGTYQLKTNFFPECYLSKINNFARGFVNQINTQYKKAEASLKEEEKSLFPLFKDLIATLLDYRKQKTVQEMQDHPFFKQLKQI